MKPAPKPLAPATGTRRRAPRQSIQLLFWFCVMFALPFYPAPSGQPQPSDYLLLAVLVLPSFVLGVRLPHIARSATARLALFVVYVALVNFAWSAFYPDTEIIDSTDS